MDSEKAREYQLDVTAACGCYELGDYCYDRKGNPTHASNEECTE